MIRNIIWDIDGTLFDTYPAISKAFQLAVNDLGGNAPINWIMKTARISLSHCVSVLADTFHLQKDDIGRKFKDYYSQIQPIEQPPFPGVINICQYICSIGGMNLIVSHRESRGVTELLEAHHMDAYFSGSITPDDGYPKKPDPAAFEAIIKIHHLIKEETIAVGDREIDIQAGQAASVLTCLFDPGRGESSADLTISSFNDFYFYLRNTASNPNIAASDLPHGKNM